jgi:hypothetical protein
MSAPQADTSGEHPLEQLAQTASQQAAVLAREQLELARREIIARAREAGPGAAMLGGGALLAALASGTGTAGLILLLARRPGASAAALGVTGAYAGAGALLAREGLSRLREAAPPSDISADDQPARKPKPDPGAGKRRAKSASQRVTAAAKTPAGTTARARPKSKSASRPKDGSTTRRS